MTEVKFENSISRLTAVANPRQIERAVRGSVFELNLIYEMENEQEFIEDMQTLAEGMKLLQYDYLGGSGSRGYGKIQFNNVHAEGVIGNVDNILIDKCSILELMQDVYSRHLQLVIEKKCKDDLLKQRTEELVQIEYNVRNIAAHNIVSATPEWVKEQAGRSVEDILWLLKYICEQVKINTRKENWDSYDYMNKRIIEELDR